MGNGRSERQAPVPSVAVVTARPHAGDWRTPWDRISGAWCGPSLRPDPIPVAPDEVASAIELGTCRVALVDRGELPPRAFGEIIDTLCEHEVPTLILDPDAPSGRGSIDGTVTLPSGTEPSEIAASLATLIAREPTMRQLKTELSRVRRFQQGLRAEVDRMHEELSLAASVQGAFLPGVLPTVNGMDMSVFFRPAGYVSGDIYDVRRLDGDRLIFLLADAVGHGVPAALMTMGLVRSFAAAAERLGREVTPEGVLSMMNEEMCARSEASPRFATAVCGIIDGASRRVTIACAGHPPPIVVDPNGATRELETMGALLGVIEDALFDSVTEPLAPGEMVICYTDGFETAYPDPKVDAYQRRLPTRTYVDRFVGMAQRWRSEGLRAAIGQLGVELDSQIGSLHQNDDLTALAIGPSLAKAA